MGEENVAVGRGKTRMTTARNKSLRWARLAAAVMVLAVPASALAGGTAAAQPGSAAATPSNGWSIQPTQTANVPTGSFTAVSCPTSNWCMTVGRYTGSQGVLRPLAESWTDATGKILSPVSAPALGTALQGVSCTSPTACVAVGYATVFGHPSPDQFGQRTFAESWNGTSWRAIAPPSFGIPSSTDTQLTGVSCATASACTAVGNLGGGVEQPDGHGLVATWNGKSWSRASTPSPKNSAVLLSSVSCTPANACVAVGSYTQSNLPARPLTEMRTRTGAAWGYRTPPVPFPSTPADLRAGKSFDLVSRSVSCPRSTACTLVGSFRSEGIGVTSFPVFAEAWNGSHWHLETVPNPQRENQLNSVSCWTATDCLALGTAGNGETSAVLAERRVGSRWTVATGPSTVTPTDQDRSLTCASATACTMVGTSGAIGRSLEISRLQGTTWTAQAAPNPVGTEQDTLADISCAVAAQCTAVGTFTGTTTEKVLIESGGPGHWSVATAPSPGGNFNSQLTSVSCPSTTFCMAVGFSLPGFDSTTASQLAEVWHGSTWQIVPSPDPGTNHGSSLDQVSCTSATFCVAVGITEQNNGTAKSPDFVFQQLIETWNGATWQITSDTSPAGSTSSSLDMVSCASATFCLAIGAKSAGSGSGTLLTESFNGMVWAPVSTTGQLAALARISCTSATFCMGVGADGQNSMAQSWNGSAWKTLAVPGPKPAGNDGSALGDLSCTSPTACTAIGDTDFLIAEAENTGDDDHPYAQSWNGSAWGAAVNLPVATDTQGTTLTGISCPAPGTCSTAGYVTKVGVEVPAIESHP
jgi:hypothetical protein